MCKTRKYALNKQYALLIQLHLLARVYGTKQIGGGAQWVELVIITLTSKPTHCVSWTRRLVLVGRLGGLFDSRRSFVGHSGPC